MSDTDEKNVSGPQGEPEAESAEEQAAETGVHADVARQGACECVVKIQAEADHMKQRYEEELETLMKEVSLPGFRQGKAPRGLVEARFGKRVRNETLASVVSDAYDEAVKANDLTIAAEVDAPDLQEMDWEVGQPVEVEFRCEVLPLIELDEAQYKGLTVERPKLEITDELLEEEMRRFAQQLGSWEKVEKGGIDQEDYVEAQVTAVTAGGQERLSKQIGFALRDERIGPFAAEGVKGALLGMEAGKSIEIDGVLPEDAAKLPQDHKDLEDLAGETLKLTVEVKEIYRQNIPQIDDELAKKLNMENADEVRNVVRERLERRLEGQGREATQYAVIDAIMANVPLDMPPSLIERATLEEQKKLMVRAMRLGTSRDQAEQLALNSAERSRETAVRSLKATYLLRYIAEKERIFVVDDEVQEQVRVLSARQGWSERKTERYMEENDLLASLRSDMRENKTLEMLIENAKLQDIEAEEFQRRIEERRQSAAQAEAEEAAEKDEAEPEAESGE